MGTPRVVTEEMIAEINRLYKVEGKSGNQIAKTLYISMATVYRHIDNPRAIGRKTHVTAEQAEEFNRLYDEEGLSSRQIAKRYEYSYVTIQKYIKNKKRVYNKVTDTEQLKEINKLYDNYVPVKDIAKKFNLSDSTVRRYLWKPRHRQNQYTSAL